MFFLFILWALYSNSVLPASLPQRSERVGSLDTGRITSSNLLSIPAPPTNNFSSENILEIACDSDRFGKNLKVKSCRNIFRYLMQDETQYTFAERDSGVPHEAPLPWRTLSGDGLCFIQPVLKRGAVSGRASGTEVGQAALQLLQTCVVERGMGGVAFNIGGDNNVNVVIASFSPNVQCDSTPTLGPPWNSTVAIFASMRASKRFRVFGIHGAPEVEEELPLVLQAVDGKSYVSIRIDGVATVASWYEIWEGVTAIAMMCTRQKHKGGKARGLGLGENIRVELSRHPVPSLGNASTALVSEAGNVLQRFEGAVSSQAAGLTAFDRAISPFELLTGDLPDDDNSSVVDSAR